MKVLPPVEKLQDCGKALSSLPVAEGDEARIAQPFALILRPLIRQIDVENAIDRVKGPSVV